MITLHLLRHAKSSWDDPDLPDHDRPLAERGQRAGRAMSAHLRRERIAPDLVLCSTARRAADTLSAVRSGLPEGVPVEITRALYEVGASEILAQLRRVPDHVRVLLVVGHNPGLEDLAAGLAGDNGEERALRALARKFPSGALATLESDGSWAGLAWGSARLVGFVTPKDLA